MVLFCLNWRHAAAALLMWSATAGAQAQDVVTWRGGVSFAHDDNFFRAPASTEQAEDITTQSLEVRVVVPYSLQRFELDLGITNNVHRNFSNFDYLGKNYSAAWLWSYTPQLHGNLSTTRTETLNAPTDSVNPGQRNRNTTTTNALSGEYELGGALRLLGGYTNSEAVNEQALVGQADNRSNSYNAGVRYVFPSGNSLAYGLARSIGSSTSAYTMTTHDLSSVWQVGGNTSLTGRLAYMEQHFGNSPQFDFNGVFGAVSATWQVTGKTSVIAAWQRDLASYQTVNAIYTQTDSVSATPVWQISPKTSLRLQHRYAVRSDQGSPAGASSGRQDRLRDTSVTYSWQPRPFASIAASLTHSARSSDGAGLDYTDRLASLSAQFSF